MAPSRDDGWREYRLGIIVASAFLIAGIGIVWLGSGRGPFQTRTVSMYTEVDDAAGVRVGSVVTVGGILAGEVTDITVVPPEDVEPLGPESLAPVELLPGERHIRIELAILEPVRRNITASSRARLVILGMGAERYVKISPGDVREPPLEPGALIASVVPLDWDLVLAKLSRALAAARVVLAITEEIGAQVVSGRSTAGHLIDAEDPLYEKFRNLQRTSTELADLLETGPGVIPRMRANDEFVASLDSLRANIRALREVADRADEGWARWSEPVELRDAIAELKAENEALKRRLDEGRGTLGRLLNDQELTRQIEELERRLQEVLAMFKSDPLGFVRIELF